MNNKTFEFFSLVCILLLSGCATITYPLTNNIPKAQLGFAQDRTFNNANSGVVFSDYKTCKLLYTIPNYPALTTINADQFNTILVTHFVGSKQLQFAATFYAKPKHTYLINVIRTKHLHNITIIMHLIDKSLDNPADEVVPLLPRIYETHYSVPSTCADNDIDFSKAAKFYVLQQTFTFSQRSSGYHRPHVISQKQTWKAQLLYP